MGSVGAGSPTAFRVDNRLNKPALPEANILTVWLNIIRHIAIQLLYNLIKYITIQVHDISAFIAHRRTW